MKEELERSGMGSTDILEYMKEKCQCYFLLYLTLFSN